MTTRIRSTNHMDGIIIMIIIAIIAMSIYGQMSPSAVGPAINAFQGVSNTTLPGYESWDSATQATYRSSGNSLALTNYIIPFVILLALLKFVL